MKHFDNRIVVDLQKFADPIPQGQSASVDDRVAMLFNEATESTPIQEPTVQEVQPSVQQEPTQPIEEPKPVQQPPTEQPLLAGKFKTADELVKGYQNLQSVYTKTAQEAAEARRMLETLQQQKPEPVSPNATEQQPPDINSLDAESYLAEFYEKPQDAIARIVEAKVKQALAPLEQKVMPVIQKEDERTNQALWDNAVSGFATVNTDMPQFIDGMKEYISKNNLGTSKEPQKVLEDAYYYAKGKSYQPPQTVDYNALAGDEKFLNDVFLKNPNAVNYVLKNHMSQVKESQPPLTINSQTSGTAAATPPNKPKNLNEAHGFFESMLGIRR